MSWKALVAIAVATVAWVACQKSICTEFQESTSTYATKYSACIPDAGPIVDAGVFDAGASTCEQHLSDCTDEDKTAITAYVACINDLATCTPETIQDWTSDFLACYSNHVTGLTSACLTALSH